MTGIMNENRPLAELLADPEYQNRNSDLSTEDVRALLAEEITPEQIYERRARANFANLVEAEKQRLAKLPTRKLLAMYRRTRPYLHSFETLHGEVQSDALKALLDTREHVETDSRKTKAMRREAARRNRGQGKSKNR